MSKAYKSLGCEAAYCTKQLYAAGLCRSHYESSRAEHPAGRKTWDQAKIGSILLENMSLARENERLKKENQNLRRKLTKAASILGTSVCEKTWPVAK